MVQGTQSKETGAKPRRRMLRFVLLGLLALVLAGIATPFVYIANAGGLAGFLQAELSKRLGGAPVAVADVGFEVQLPSFTLTVLASDVALTLDGNSLTVPQASIVMTPRALLQWAPSDIVLTGLDLDLTLDPERLRASPLGALAAIVAAPVDGTSDDNIRKETAGAKDLDVRSPLPRPV